MSNFDVLSELCRDKVVSNDRSYYSILKMCILRGVMVCLKDILLYCLGQIRGNLKIPGGHVFICYFVSGDGKEMHEGMCDK